MSSSKHPALGPRYRDALVYAAHLHRRQFRKATRIPYVAHLIGVSSLVLEDGGDEDEAIAALLHDAVEDQGGPRTLAAIRKRYGARVASIVHGCTDSDRTPKPPWRERKEGYLARLRTEPPSVLRVSLADKVHNARSLVRDIGVNGWEVWTRFRAGPPEQAWYYRSLLEIFRARSQSPMVAELERLVGEIERLAAEVDRPIDLGRRIESQAATGQPTTATASTDFGRPNETATDAPIPVDEGPTKGGAAKAGPTKAGTHAASRAARRRRGKKPGAQPKPSAREEPA